MSKVYYTRQAQKDARKLASSGFKSAAEELIKIISDNPYENCPPYEKLVGDLSGAISRRINIRHKLVYQVFGKEESVKILRLWTRYE